MATQSVYRVPSAFLPGPMIISRKLVHQVRSKLQVIMSQIETDNSRAALDSIHALADFLNSHTESRDQENARSEREHSEDST